MDHLFPVLSNCLVALFDMVLFMSLNTPRGNPKRTGRILWSGCIAMLAAYLVVTCFFEVRMAAASVLCMTLPSLILFWFFSAHRDARFLLTFCLADSTSYIVGYFARLPGLAVPQYKSAIDLVCTVVFFTALLAALRKAFPQYRAMLELPRKGWWDMAVASAVVYLAQIVTTSAIGTIVPIHANPRLLVALALWCAAITCCYLVFVRTFSMIIVIHSQNEQLLQEKEYHAIAYTDTLTGLDNRASYMEHCAELDRLDPAVRSQYTLLFLDLDNFKWVNDSFGHLAGDIALQHTATALREAFRGPEFRVFRYGGDEFVATAAGVSPEDLAARLRLIQEKLAESCAEYSLTISCGMARFSPDDTAESALARADKAMYTEKNAFEHPAGQAVPD